MSIVIVGSGISGLLYALIAAERFPQQEILIVEKETQPGGLLRCFDYGLNGKFDMGMHNFLETSIAELDQIIFGLLAPNEWQVLSGSKRDLAGIFYNGKLQTQTPYIDLRNLSSENYRACVAGLISKLDEVDNNARPDVNVTAAEFMTSRFGTEVAEIAVLPVLEKIHKKNAAELDYMATIFTPLTRVTLCDEALARELTQSEFLRRFIAYSEQRNLPLERSTGRSGYYPAEYGMYRVIEAMIKQIIQKGGKVLLGSGVEKVEVQNNRIGSVTIRKDEGYIEVKNPLRFVWTSNIPLLGRFLQVDFSGLKNDKPLKTVVISMLLNRRLQMNDLYYFFCYDKPYHTFRVNDFTAYCDGAPRNGGFPISIEFLVEENYLASKPDIALDAEKELFSFGITEPGTKVLFSKAEILESGFPMPSRNNILALKSIREQIKNLKIQNLDILGILAEDNLFFQTDVLIDTFYKAKK